MDPMVIRVGIMGIFAVISGFFLLGFAIYSIYAAVEFFVKKSKSKKANGKEKIWGGLTGLTLNGLVFLLTFPRVIPVVSEVLDKLIDRFL